MENTMPTASRNSRILPMIKSVTIELGSWLMTPWVEMNPSTSLKYQNMRPFHCAQNLPSIRIDITWRNSMNRIIKYVRFEISRLRVRPKVKRVSLRSKGDLAVQHWAPAQLEFVESVFIFIIFPILLKPFMLLRRLIKPIHSGSRKYFSTGKTTAPKVGTVIEQTIQITEQQSRQYNALFHCNDNPKQISIGYLGSLFSRLIGTNIHHSIYLSQTLAIMGEAKPGQILKCYIKISEDLGKNRYKLLTVVEKDNKMVVQGQAIILHQVK